MRRNLFQYNSEYQYQLTSGITFLLRLPNLHHRFPIRRSFFKLFKQLMIDDTFIRFPVCTRSKLNFNRKRINNSRNLKTYWTNTKTVASSVKMPKWIGLFSITTSNYVVPYFLRANQILEYKSQCVVQFYWIVRVPLLIFRFLLSFSIQFLTFHLASFPIITIKIEFSIHLSRFI